MLLGPLNSWQRGNNKGKREKIMELMNIELGVPFLINTVKESGRVLKNYRELYTIHKYTERQCFPMSKYFVGAPLRR